MEKITKFFNGDPAETKLFGPHEIKGPKMITKDQKDMWLKRRNDARKTPPPFAIVQKPEVYD